MEGGRYQVRTERGVTSLTIRDVVQEDCDKYTLVVRNSLAEHAAFASLAVGSKYTEPSGVSTRTWYKGDIYYHKPRLMKVTKRHEGWQRHPLYEVCSIYCRV